MVCSHDGLGNRARNCHRCRREYDASIRDHIAAVVDGAAGVAGTVVEFSLLRYIAEGCYTYERRRSNIVPCDDCRCAVHSGPAMVGDVEQSCTVFALISAYFNISFGSTLTCASI